MAWSRRKSRSRRVVRCLCAMPGLHLQQRRAQAQSALSHAGCPEQDRGSDRFSLFKLSLSPPGDLLPWVVAWEPRGFQRASRRAGSIGRVAGWTLGWLAGQPASQLFGLNLGWIWLWFGLDLVGFGLISAYYGLLLFIMARLESHVALIIL